MAERDIFLDFRLTFPNKEVYDRLGDRDSDPFREHGGFAPEDGNQADHFEPGF